MTHEFSSEIHMFITSKIEDCQQAIQQAESDNNRDERSYQNGKLKEFMRIRKVMNETIDLDTQNYY